MVGYYHGPFSLSCRANVARPGIHSQRITPCKWVPDRVRDDTKVDGTMVLFSVRPVSCSG